MKMRRSVGAEVNWGIRFTCEADADTFLESLAGTWLHTHFLPMDPMFKNESSMVCWQLNGRLYEDCLLRF